MAPYARIASSQPHDVYLEVELNGRPTPLIVHFREQQGKLRATGEDLNEIGIAIDKLGIPRNSEVNLDDIPGLAYKYDVARQAVAFTVADTMRVPYQFNVRQLEKIPAATASRGLLVNYEAYAQYDSGTDLALWSEERYFDSAGVLSNTGVAYMNRDWNRYVRFDTSWRHSNPDALTTTQLGDMISSSLDWSRSVRMGGFQWRSNFELRPDLVTFPMPAIAGSAVVPSSLDLYVNNVRQFSSDVPSGPFVVNDVPGITGGGMATILTRDALGRTVSTSVPLYIDRRLLAPGLSSYSLEAGFMRRNYGTSSFDYSTRPALSGSMRYGVNDALTMEGHVEATEGLYNAGMGGLVRLGMAGVINGSVSASGGRFAGMQASLGYQWIQPNFSIDAQTIRTFGNYGDLAAREEVPVPSAINRFTLSLPVMENQTVSLSYIGFKMPDVSESRIGSMAYSVNLGNRMSLNLSAYKDFAQQSSNGVFLSLNISLDNEITVNTNAGRQNGESSYNANALRAPDYDGGWGWGAQAGSAGGTRYQQAQLQYLGNYGEVTAIAQKFGEQTSGALNASGAVVLMDGSVQFARRVYDGFALVSTDGVADIPILHENRVIGNTDANGHMLIPDLNAYQHNSVGIDALGLPPDMRVQTTSMDVVPQSQSGVVAHFPVQRYSAASIILQDADGKVLPVGARVFHKESGKSTIVGYDGVAFIEDLQSRNHLVVEAGHKKCVVDFMYGDKAEGSLPALGPLICRLQQEDLP